MRPQKAEHFHVRAAIPRFDIATIFRDHAAVFTQANLLNAQQMRVLAAVTACRTAKLGGHVLRCSGCEDRTVVYNSCRNRHCPKCLNAKQALWLAQRESTILPTRYFHVVLTVPAELRQLVQQNPKLLLGLLMRAAADTLLTLGRDPRHLGAQLGISAVLHTWTRTLMYHPHVHCLVTAGGLSLDGHRWIASRPGFLFATAVVQRLFRGRFMAGLCALYRDGKLNFSGSLAPLREPAHFRKLKHALYDKTWVVYTKAPFGGPEQIFAYLGRYTHRVGITNARLRHVDAASVTFTTRDSKTTTVTPLEFIRRFLLHTLPVGFVKIRHYGLMAGRHVRTSLATAHRLLTAASPTTVRSKTPTKREAAAQALLSADTWQDRLLVLTGRNIMICQACGNARVLEASLARCDTS